MAGIKHLVMAKFKEGAAVEQLLLDMKKLALELDIIKSFEWGEDVMENDKYSHGFTHTFIFMFDSAEDVAAYMKHPRHVEYGKKFRAGTEKILAVDFPTVIDKIATA
ncbi:stress-response A/B barrel domain-containing protein At5g22580-like isoform X3 [Zingiber officinale]|uniref:Stress-response A/B barrel domain-containing protein n=1 Tax=Zingiber officinale TaxID=94328 RepID=A0A8J5HLI7_ZINOF|nr:stress-response A/B barrel domain-containing protein At5g22580-like isoform X2 [Zingiber officinale]XP_042426665.1 stress-response A/B barrel domain-containing protein At5g22580-like isoform X3 [Zingiber officinale]KAG6530943.1 hypothetical protein ZIOFF_004710 [Zingiber officinale]